MKLINRFIGSRPIMAFLVINLVFILVHVHQYISYFRISYEKQNLEKQLASVKSDYEDVVGKYETMQNLKTVKKYVAQKLGMELIGLKQVRNLAKKIIVEKTVEESKNNQG